MPSRTLLYFPIVHSQSDMGALGESIRRVTLQKLGERVWHRKINLIKQFWSEVEDTLNGLPLSYPNILLYQDGLPVCGKEAEIVAELAQKGSPNHRLLARLMANGAKIVGTESAELLIEEYRLTRNILESGGYAEATQVEARQKSASDLLLDRRDAFIAERIDGTLPEGGTGILFLGVLHDLDGRLPGDIVVLYPMSSSRKEG
jgi:hypothetical protein